MDQPAFCAVTRYDGHSLLLFHMEHLRGQSWEVEVHEDDSFSKVVAASANDEHFLRLPLNSGDRSFAVRARRKGGEWGQVALRVLDHFEADFMVEARRACEVDDDLVALSLSGDDLCAFFKEGVRLKFQAGERCEITMTGYYRYSRAIGLGAGELFSESDDLRITNVSEVRGGLSEREGAEWVLGLDERLQGSPSFMVTSRLRGVSEKEAGQMLAMVEKGEESC